MAKAVKHLTPPQLAERWAGSVCVGTLANWRAARPRKGPKFLRVGGRVVYALPDVRAYERSRRK